MQRGGYAKSFASVELPDLGEVGKICESRLVIFRHSGQNPNPRQQTKT